MSDSVDEDWVATALDDCIQSGSFSSATRILVHVKNTFPRCDEYREKLRIAVEARTCIHCGTVDNTHHSASCSTVTRT
jgi:hypothetical protein